MIQKIQGEAPFQVLASSFSISPSLQNYVLQISADGVNYSDLFNVSAGTTKMCTGMANGSYYRLKNNASEVTVNWRTQCNDGGGGGSSDYAASAGTANYANTSESSNSTKLLEGSSALPQDANAGDVVAVAPAPTKGLRSANTTLGVYQFDGTDWNKIEGGEGSSVYKIELSTVDPEDYAQEDRATLNDFFAAYSADTSIADSAYIYAVDKIYRCVRYVVTQQFSTFTFQGTLNNNIVDIFLHFASNTFIYGNMQNAVPTPDFTTLEPVSELPADAETGDVVALSIPEQEGEWVMYDASASPTKVRILTKGDGTYLLHFNENNLYIGLDYAAGDPPTFSGEGWGLTQDDTYEWHYDNNGYYINVWAEEQDGEWYIYADMTQGEGGFTMLDAYEIGSWYDMYIDGTASSLGVYQYDGTNWNAIGGGAGGSDFVHLDSLSGTGETGKTYEFKQRLYKWVNGSGKWGRWITTPNNNYDGTGYSYGNMNSWLLYSYLPETSEEIELVRMYIIGNYSLGYTSANGGELHFYNSDHIQTGETPAFVIRQGDAEVICGTNSSRKIGILWTEGKIRFRCVNGWAYLKTESLYSTEVSTSHWEAYEVDLFRNKSNNGSLCFNKEYYRKRKYSSF